MIYYKYGTRSSKCSKTLEDLHSNIVKYTDDKLGIFPCIFYCYTELAQKQIIDYNLEFIGVEDNESIYKRSD
jgi:hypothetical protein